MGQAKQREMILENSIKEVAIFPRWRRANENEDFGKEERREVVVVESTINTYAIGKGRKQQQ